MVLTSPAVAATLEAAEAWHLRVQVETWRALGAADARAVEIGGGVAAFTEPLFGRKLNHVTGLGMEGPVAADALAREEQPVGVVARLRHEQARLVRTPIGKLPVGLASSSSSARF